MHLEEQALAVDTKQSRQAWLHCSLPDLLAWVFGFVPTTSACSLEWISAAATNSTNKAKQGG